MRPSFIKTAVAGDVLSSSPRLRPASTDTLKDNANSLTVISRLESETNPSQTLRTSTGISPAYFRWNCYMRAQPFASRSIILKSDSLRYGTPVIVMNLRIPEKYLSRCDFGACLAGVSEEAISPFYA